MNLTQNIDDLESKTGLREELLCQAHGSIKGAACSECKFAMNPLHFKEHVKRGEIYKCTKCYGAVKPNIIFFGETLPKDFFVKIEKVEECDLMIVMGTALAVSPFNSLVEMVEKGTH